MHQALKVIFFVQTTNAVPLIRYTNITEKWLNTGINTLTRMTCSIHIDDVHSIDFDNIDVFKSRDKCECIITARIIIDSNLKSNLTKFTKNSINHFHILDLSIFKNLKNNIFFFDSICFCEKSQLINKSFLLKGYRIYIDTECDSFFIFSDKLERLLENLPIKISHESKMFDNRQKIIWHKNDICARFESSKQFYIDYFLCISIYFLSIHFEKSIEKTFLNLSYMFI